MKTLLALLVVLGALVVGSGSAAGVGASVGASDDFGTASFIPHFGSPASPHAVKALNAASNFTCGAITCAAYEAGVNGYLQDVAADSGTTNNVYSVSTEYYDDYPNLLNSGPVAYDDTFAGTYEDTQQFPASGCQVNTLSACLTESQLVTEIKKDMAAKGWTDGSQPAQNLFVILLPSQVDTCDDSGSFCASNYFCAYHDYAGHLNGDGVIFAVEPFNSEFGCSGANEPTNPQGLPNGPEIDETVNTLSHETNEAITDPEWGTGWTSPQGDEEADLCEWWFGAPLGTVNGQPYNQVINGHDYSLQQEFSNSANSGAGGCLQQPGGTASSASPYTGGDAGPLTYGNGYVMRSAHVYTIYWIPGPTPEISTAPVVTGKDGVGKTLSTTPGSWTNSPTSYTYKWLRCDSSGSNCVPIGAATHSKYTLLSGDAGHTFRSVVLARNVNGLAAAGSVQSAQTAVVVAAPKVIDLPGISGTPQAGMTLAVGEGVWTYSPTHYAYQWLLCSAAGTSCKAIKNGLADTYKLVAADVGHTLEAKVTASNVAGKHTATTGKTPVIAS